MSSPSLVHVLTPRQRCDLELLLSGAFFPLAGFMDQDTFESVCEQARLPDGSLWPIPITLEIPETLARKLGLGDTLRLERSDGIPLAHLKVTSVYLPDRQFESYTVYGSTDPAHPGVAQVLSAPPWNVGGPVLPWDGKVLERAASVEFPAEYRTPENLRPALGTGPVLAFQTRNPMHHAHLAITRAALERLGPEARLLLHPAIGPTKPGDIEAAWRMRAYRAILPYYPAGRAILSPLPLAMRMAGPREALWHAIIRRNYGATHFLVGRAHADPGSQIPAQPFYPPYAAQELLARHSQQLGIVPILMPEYAYSPSRQCHMPSSEAHGEPLEELSGTELRRRLAANEEIPDWFSPPEVIHILRLAYRGAEKRGLVIWFTGLSASGKSTLAGLLARELERHETRAITLLDGDVVRRFLSRGLGFSREDRDENIRRIGFVASLVAQHGGIALVAAISPYAGARGEARRLVTEASGTFIEVYVSTPLAICAERDPKGLYARALAGDITNFTGVSDPYEPPDTPEIVLDTSTQIGAEALQVLLSELTRLGALGGNQ